MNNNKNIKQADDFNYPRLGRHWNTIQKSLFPVLEDELGELSDEQKAFVSICELLIDDSIFYKYRWSGNGRKPHSRLAMFKAFILKALWNLPTTRSMIDAVRNSPTLRRLCGWESLCDIPTEYSFSRAFAEFASDGIADKVLTTCTKQNLGKKMLFHVSHDSTAIEAREQGMKRPKENRTWAKEDQRTFKQRSQDADVSFHELPTNCDWGRKLNSKGRILQWRGYKLHVSVLDGDIPLTAFLSAASLHDSQVAIPLMKKTSETFDYFYDLADAAYDANDILEESVALGHCPLVEANPRKDKVRHAIPGAYSVGTDIAGAHAVNLTHPEDRRYRLRSAVERLFSHLHDSHGGKTVRVRGHNKVFLHLMFGLLVIAAEQLLKLLD